MEGSWHSTTVLCSALAPWVKARNKPRAVRRAAAQRQVGRRDVLDIASLDQHELLAQWPLPPIDRSNADRLVVGGVKAQLSLVNRAGLSRKASDSTCNRPAVTEAHRRVNAVALRQVALERAIPS